MGVFPRRTKQVGDLRSSGGLLERKLPRIKSGEETMESFGVWLKGRAGENSVLGDLADDFVRDCERTGKRPSTFKTPERLRKRLAVMGASEVALEALEEAESVYLMAKRVK